MQDIFKDFILNKISTREFEKQIYQCTELEKILGEERYSRLISFDFNQNDVNYELIKLLEEIIIPEQDHKYWRLRSIFSKCGWYEGRKFNIGPIYKSSSSSLGIARDILNEFGGLEIDTYKESKYNWGDISFFKTPIVEISKTLGPIAYFASAQRSYSHLCVDNKGKFYINFDVTGELYFLRESFDDAMEAILFHLEIGEFIEKEESQITENHNTNNESALVKWLNKIFK